MLARAFASARSRVSASLRASRPCLLIVLVCASSLQSAVHAAEPVSFARMNHKTWTARDGAPQGVLSLVQDPDGSLWIGTEVGLFNFDGLSFRPFRPFPGEADLPVGNISALRVARDGSLWAATLRGAVRISHGHTTHHPEVDGKMLMTLLGLSAAADGSMWGFGRPALVRFGPDGVDHLEETPLEVDTNAIGGLFIDSSDTLWLAQGNRLYRRSSNASAYVATDAQADFVFAFSETPERNLWITDFDTKNGYARYQLVSHDGRVLALLKSPGAANGILYVPDGSLIIASQLEGLRRYEVGTTAAGVPDLSKQQPESFTHADGLAGDVPRALLLDRDNNIWVGNVRGLDRFRGAQLIPFRTAHTSTGRWKICGTPDGDIWISGAGSDLYKVSHGVRTEVPNSGDIYHITCGSDGDVWVVDKAGVRVAHAGNFTQLPPIPGAAPYGVGRMAATASHELYVPNALPAAAAGIWHFKDGQWDRFAGSGSLAATPQVMYADTKNRVWAGYRNGIVALPFEGEGRVFESGSPGLDIVLSILETSHGVFAAGTNGAAIYRDTRFEMLRFADPATVRGVGGMIDAPNGDLWLNGAQGVVRVPAAELDAVVADPSHVIDSTLVTEGDYVGPVPLVVKDAAARDADGNLWFSAINGVFHLNPMQLDPGVLHAPIVSLRSMSVDGRPLAAGARIGPDPQTLVIQYFGINLTSPQSVVYKYRLDGLEDAWQDAGRRTEAIYTHLGPGSYTFRVMASNGDGKWSSALVLPAFTVLPSFFQTAWFAVLCALAGVVLIFGVSALRINAITRSVRARIEERADERVRIARDLHDTLLQGVQGLLLNVHVAAQKIPDGSPSKPMLERALSTADRIIIEGRNRLSALRSEHVTDLELVEAIENVCSDLASTKALQWQVSRRGAPALKLYPHVADEMFYIAREALTNAFRYAEATRIEVVLDYGRRRFELACEDDGRGFSANAHDKREHWGLKGMAERAAKLGGNFECRSAAMQGTRIGVGLPAFRAYHTSRWRYVGGLLRRARNPG